MRRAAVLAAVVACAAAAAVGVGDVDQEADEPARPAGSSLLAAEQRVVERLLGSLDGGGGGRRRAYDWRVRPQPHYLSSDPVVVTVNMYLRTLSHVDDVNMEYKLQLTFREMWTDDRLYFNDKDLPYVNLSPDQKIWMPDTFFQNEKDGKKHNIDTPNVLLRVFNGSSRVLYSVRVTLVLSCPMHLHNYPMDVQTCHLDLASYAHTAADIDYRWETGRPPVQLNSRLRTSLPDFRLANVTTTECTSRTNTGTYSCLRLILVLEREFGHYVMQLYIPSFMLVVVSWVSFCLDEGAVTARVGINVAMLLSLTLLASGINAKLPPVSYTKAIDVWIGVCLAFIFGALLEFALINYAARRDIMAQSGRRRVDTLAAILFPLAFVAFNVVYWLAYL